MTEQGYFMNAILRDLSMVQGDTMSFGFQVQGLGGQEPDEIQFSCKSSLENSDYVFAVVLGDNINLRSYDSEHDLLTYGVRIPPEATAGVQAGRYFYDLELKVNNDVITLMIGKLSIVPEVTNTPVPPAYTDGDGDEYPAENIPSGQKKIYTVQNISDIARAINEKSGSSGSYTTSEMPQAIRDIEVGVDIVQVDGVRLNGELYIEMPFNLVSPNRSYYIEFTTETSEDASGEHVIFGIKNDYYTNFVGVFYMNLRYQVGQNGGYTNIQNSWEELTGRHSFLYDGAGNVQFDGTNTYTYYPNNTNGDGYALILGGASETPRTSHTWKGIIHRFTIRDTENDVTLADFVPASKVAGGQVAITGLYDLINETFVTAPTLSVVVNE